MEKELKKVIDTIQSKVTEKVIELIQSEEFSKELADIARAVITKEANNIIKFDGDVQTFLRATLEKTLNEHLAKGQIPSNLKANANVSIYISLDR